jgi:5-methylcytosine-specific restriction endonuclease McrA
MNNVLVLNFTYEKMNVVKLRRAVRLVFAGKAEVLHTVDRQIRSAGGLAFEVPAVIRMLYFVKLGRKRVPLTKKNVLLRDDYRCQYCGSQGSNRNMTVDHVLPKSVGGPSTWENLVAACSFCNGRKKDRTPEQAGMPLRRKPRVPAFIPFVVISRNTEPQEWTKYLTLYNISIDNRIR